MNLVPVLPEFCSGYRPAGGAPHLRESVRRTLWHRPV